MTTTTTPVFDLPERLAAKSDHSLVGGDEAHFARISLSLEGAIANLTERLSSARRAPGGAGRAAMDRDLEIHRLSGRLSALQRYGVDLCLGHMVLTDSFETVYVGRLGLTDAQGARLLVDWRSPAAEPFFGATHADPMGLTRRRRYRWQRERITDYWDEVFADEGLASHAALDDQSAFIASLGGARSARMRDVLGTIAADQDAIVRSGSRGALVVDGGPGTGKTVVALHRTAYLLYSDPRLGHRKGGVLFVGPHQPYVSYVSDVLPSLGEEGVSTCTIRDIVPEGACATVESDPEVARLKSTVDMVAAIDPAVGIYEQAPTDGLVVETPWADVWFSPDDWADAFDAVEHGTPHNEARVQIWEEIVTILTEKHVAEGAEVPEPQLRRELADNDALVTALHRAWPMLDAEELVGDLWAVPAYLHKCVPHLTRDEIFRLQRTEPTAWTTSDLPLLDAARRRLGDASAAGRQRRRAASADIERDRMALVIDDLIAADPDGEGLATMLRHPDLRENLVDDIVPTPTPDRLGGPFAHIVVDEAQELTDAEWRMLLARCPSRSLTIVGDRAQARHGFAESWEQRLARVGLDHVTVAGLSINYRTPEEVMAVAEPEIRAALPDANVPTSIRSTGVPVRFGHVDGLEEILADWLEESPEGVASVIGHPDFATRERITSLTPELAKGLEFDLVVLIDPDGFGKGIEGAVDRYVAMTRATRELVILTSSR